MLTIYNYNFNSHKNDHSDNYFNIDMCFPLCYIVLKLLIVEKLINLFQLTIQRTLNITISDSLQEETQGLNKFSRSLFQYHASTAEL